MIFADAGAYILRHWWKGIPREGDRFAFIAGQKSPFIEMPVLFYEYEHPLEPDEYHGAAAYTSNFINSLVDGPMVVTGLSYGPVVDLPSGMADILEAYSNAAFALGGLTDIHRTDARIYHNLFGFIHCGINVVRDVPGYDWWDF